MPIAILMIRKADGDTSSRGYLRTRKGREKGGRKIGLELETPHYRCIGEGKTGIVSSCKTMFAWSDKRKKKKRNKEKKEGGPLVIFLRFWYPKKSAKRPRYKSSKKGGGEKNVIHDLLYYHARESGKKGGGATFTLKKEGEERAAKLPDYHFGTDSLEKFSKKGGALWLFPRRRGRKKRKRKKKGPTHFLGYFLSGACLN